MIKVDKIEVMGFEAAIRGMRNPLDSWAKSDSINTDDGYVLGPNDLKLFLNLTKAGASHRKMLRMIHIQMDVEAPLYWWKDYDTYKVATVANSRSTMHKIHAYEFTRDMFSTDQLDPIGLNCLDVTINYLNYYRDIYMRSLKEGSADKASWYKMVQLLPTSFNQRRTIDINYETALAIINDRQNHRLYEFREFTKELLKIPYMSELHSVYSK